MTLLTRLFGKAPVPGAAARETASAPQGENAQAKSGENTRDSAVADVAALGFGDALVQLAFDQSGGERQRAAQKRLAELIDANEIRVGQLPRGATEDAVVLAITAQCEQPEPFEALAAHIKDSAIWVDLATHGVSARLRQLAAQHVEGQEALRAVLKAARERDKNVYRIVKSKLDEIHAEERRVDAARAHKVALADTLERHSYKHFDGAYVATLEHLEKDWRSLEVSVAEEIVARAEAAIDRARETISDHIRAAGAQAARESAIANAVPLRENALIDLRKMLVAMLEAESFEPGAATNVRERVTILDERWQATLQHKPATREESAQFQALRESVRTAAEEIATHGTLQMQIETATTTQSGEAFKRIAKLLSATHTLAEDELPAIAMHARAVVAQHDEERSKQREAIATTEQQVANLLRKAQQALVAGRSRQAVGMRRSLEAKIQSLPQVPKHLVERLQQFDAKLHELEDWKRFAVSPKRGELIEEMQSLVGSDAEPTQLAEQIKQLQEDWKSLAKGSSDSDEDWQKFHAAAQAAYEPCRQFFEAQAQERARSLERRRALVARLGDYERTTDWEHVEWKNVANALRSARQEWRDCGPTERAATKPLEQEFEALLERVHQRLSAEYAANLERKELLVKQAQRLASQTDLSQAAEEVKRLQHAWREVGLTSHREGQSLWEEFKRHCDAVFEKRRTEHAERNALYDQSEGQAAALCSEAELLSRRSGVELFAGAARARELRESFAMIDHLPPHKAQALQRRFSRALADFDSAMARQRDEDMQRAWDEVFAFADQIRVRQVEGHEATTIAQELGEGVKRLSKSGAAAIQRKLNSNGDITANTTLMRDLVIRAEIASELQTPPSDQARRREMQLQSLVARRGEPVGSVREQLEALALELIALGPVSSPAYEELFARFRGCFQRR